MYKSKYQKASSRIAKRGRSKRNFLLFIKFGLPLFFLICLIFISRLDFLQIKNLAILGTESINQEEIKTTVNNFLEGYKFLVVPKTDIVFVNKDKLSTVLLSQFPRLEDVEINKQFFSRGLQIAVKERSADYLWCAETGACFFLNKSGLIFEKTDFSESDFWLSSKDYSQIVANKIIFKGVLFENPLMQNFVSTETMQKYIEIIATLKNSGFEIFEINVKEANKAIIKTNIGEIFINPEDGDLMSAVQNVILLVNDQKSHVSSADQQKFPIYFEYIDARFGSKLYYKLIK